MKQILEYNRNRSKPSDKSLDMFCENWYDAQKRKDVEAMERLLEVRWLNHWWWARERASTNKVFSEMCLGCIERTLMKAGIIGDRPERPSERAMRLASRSFK